MRMIQRGAIAALALFSAAVGGCATTPGSTTRWQVIRSSDPITGISSCVVAAPDQVGGFNFTRSLVLYPIVEQNSERGLLVGVSSGGQYRVPVGQVLWRVDDQPFREIGRSVTDMASAFATPGRSPADIARMQQEMIETATASSTVADGSEAAEMLQEMREGRTLLFRQKQAAASYGLPGAGASAVGQINGDGSREAIPLDGSFAAGLVACGIE
ncbi:hypothetical protein [Brevundimonas sp. TWP2-3-2]|uniref:hypothetical protein n=1 Tax=unclassified Brevundimonas TaxID=2622653 RepID=UPI003CFA7473